MAELFSSSTEIGLPTLTATTPSLSSFSIPATYLSFYISPVQTNELSIYNTEKITPRPWQGIHPTLNPFMPHELPPPPKDLLELLEPSPPKQLPQQSSQQQQQWYHLKSNTSNTFPSQQKESPQSEGSFWLQTSPSEAPALSSPMSNQNSPMDIDGELSLPRPVPTRPYNCYSRSRESSVQSEASDQRKHSQSSTSSPGKSGKKCVSSDERAERRKKGNTESQARSRQHNKVIKDLYEYNDALIKEISNAYLSRGRSDPLICQLLKEYKTLPKKQRPYKKRAPSTSV